MSASGGGGGPFIANGRIQWRNLLGTAFGATVLAWFSGFVSVVLGIADIPIALLGGLADFAAAVVTVVAGLPSVIVESGFSAAVPFVVESGPAGFVVAVGIVLVTLFAATEVLSRVR